MANQDSSSRALPHENLAPGAHALSPNTVEAGKTRVGSETRDKIDGVPLERWHERNVYHRQTMEARRSIQMKVFTGCVVLLLGLAKGGQDLLSGAGSTEEVRIALILGALAVPVFLLLFMLQIESVNKRSREWYHYYERRLDGHLARGESNAPETPQKESWLKALFRSWAATWPVLATLFLALLVAYTFSYVHIGETQARGDGRAPVAQDPKPPDTGAVTNTQPQQGSGN